MILQQQSKVLNGLAGAVLMLVNTTATYGQNTALGVVAVDAVCGLTQAQMGDG